MKKLLLALLLLPSIAWAQQYPNHSMLVGAGPGTTGFKILGPCAIGQVPTWASGQTADPTCGTPPGTGTVISVGLGLPTSTFSVTGSPITGGGTLTGAFVNQNSNTVFAGPTTGIPGTPLWRALLGADLPTPTTTTIGGVQAIVAVPHQWINSINASGVPQLVQPSFLDINGTVAGSQLPTPTTSTLGGVLSITPVTSNWVNSISTAGAPVLSQPTFNDISGQLGVGQIQILSAFSLPANATSISAIPTNVSLTAFIDAAFGSAQGDVLYRGATAWTVLAPGTSGQVLQTAGASANPVWATVSGVGTVTSVTCGTGLSGGTFTASGTCALSSVSDGTVLSNISGASGVSSANSLSSVFDHDIANVQGDIIFRGGSVWSALGPGTSGQFLQTQGAAANPRWTAAPFINFLSGLALSNDGTTPNTVLDIASGAAFDSTNAAVIQLASAFTKTTGGAWVSGTANAGMGNGLTIAASTWYHVCLANNSGNTDIWFDTSAICANRPAGISDTKYRRIGSFKTNASSQILGFVQNGDYVWSVNYSEISARTTALAQALFTLAGIPLGVTTQPILAPVLSNTGSSSNWTFTMAPAAQASNSNFYTNLLNSAGNSGGGDAVTVIGPPSNTSAQIGLGLINNGGTISASLNTVGYIDTRGKL